MSEPLLAQTFKLVKICIKYKLKSAKSESCRREPIPCKGVVKHHLPVNTGCAKDDGTFGIKNVEINIIPESDMYRLIMHSKLESAL